MAPLQLKLLGAFAASLSTGRAIDVSGKKNQALLAYLALQGGKKLPREKLVGLLWSERGEAQARASLRQALAALRRDLEEIEPAVLVFEGDSVGVEPAAIATDVGRFERLANSDVAEDLCEAARIYEGDLLDSIAIRDSTFEEWLDAERGRLRETAIGSLTHLLERQTGPQAIATGQRLLAFDPLREGSHRTLMRAYAAQGQRDQALRQYRACRDLLRKELQIEPSKETEALRREIEAGGGQAEPGQSHETAKAEARPAPLLADKPSIAVQPFINMSGDPEQEYFSDGITEDIITALSRFRNLTVVARNSSFFYKGKAVTIATLARELGVEYVLEGSVRRAGQRLRVTAQLIHVASGNHVWAERYDRELTDIFAVQDEVTHNIVGTMAVELDEESLKQARPKSPQDLRAYEHWLRGKSIINLMGQKTLEARQHFERAIAIDPSYARAHSGLSEAYMNEFMEFPLPGESRTAALEMAFEHAQRAVTLDDTDYEAHSMLAMCHLYRRNLDLARKHIDRAIKLNPNAADTLAMAAYELALLGDAAQAIECGKAALRLNPHQPDWYLGMLCVAFFTARNYGEAFALRLRAPDVFIDSGFFGAAILAHMGRVGEARRWAEKALARLMATPGGALAIDEDRVVDLLLENNPYFREEDRNHFAEGMRKAGVPG